MTAQQFGGVIVEEQYDSTILQSGEALSCYDLTKVSAVKTAVDNLAKEMTADGDETDLRNARGHTNEAGTNAIHYFNANDEIEWIVYPFFDLYDLCQIINGDGNFTVDARNYANTVMNDVDNMVVYSFGGSGFVGFTNGQNGVSIFSPDGNRVYELNPHWAYQWWYNAIETNAWWSGGHYYGKLSWCIDNATTAIIGDVGNWFEMLDSWHDPTNPLNGGVNGYQW